MIALHPTFVMANRTAIENEIERLIGLLDAADAPAEDLEPEVDSAIDDAACDLSRDELSPVLPRYGDDQTAGPINEREMRREHHKRMMEGWA